MRYALIVSAALAAAVTSAKADVVMTLDSLPYTSGASYYNGSDSAGKFVDQAVTFTNVYNTTYSSWSGWSYSKVNNTTTPGYGNQYAAITGTDVSGAGNYAVAYVNAWSSSDTVITLPVPTQVKGMDVTNTTYDFLSMKNGDAFAKQFTSSDWFKLTITGYDSIGNSTGSVTTNLATGTDLLSTWNWVDLSSLGTNVKSLNFTLASSDNGTYGMNTPSYFAMDNLTVAAVPEPATVGLTSLGLLVTLARRRRESSK